MNQQDLHKFARLGAQARLEALQREMEGLLRQFPGLSSQTRGRRGRAPKGNALAGAVPVKRNMSAAARKRISDAAKKRWTEWRKKNKRD